MGHEKSKGMLMRRTILMMKMKMLLKWMISMDGIYGDVEDLLRKCDFTFLSSTEWIV